MESKELATPGQITGKLIINWIIYDIIFGIIYSIIYGLISENLNDSLVLQAIISIVLKGIIVVLVWKGSTMSAFAQKTISYDDVPNVMKKLTIFTIIICVLGTISSFITVNQEMDAFIEKNANKFYYDETVLYLATGEQGKYNQEKEKAIQNAKSEAKKRCYPYLAILEIGSMVIYLGALPFEKKEILKYVK